MKKTLFWISLVLAFGISTLAIARVVRPAPSFAWIDETGKARELKSLLGQPAILLIAPSPRDRKFRAQVRQLESEYQRFAATGLVCFAAFTEETGPVESNIPFVVAADGPRVAFLYEVAQGFATGVIGIDGNLDYLTTKVVPAQRILDVMDNNFAKQEYLRRP